MRYCNVSEHNANRHAPYCEPLLRKRRLIAMHDVYDYRFTITDLLRTSSFDSSCLAVRRVFFQRGGVQPEIFIFFDLHMVHGTHDGHEDPFLSGCVNFGGHRLQAHIRQLAVVNVLDQKEFRNSVVGDMRLELPCGPFDRCGGDRRFKVIGFDVFP